MDVLICKFKIFYTTMLFYIVQSISRRVFSLSYDGRTLNLPNNIRDFIYASNKSNLIICIYLRIYSEWITYNSWTTSLDQEVNKFLFSKWWTIFSYIYFQTNLWTPVVLQFSSMKIKREVFCLIYLIFGCIFVILNLF